MKLNVLNWEYTFDSEHQCIEISGDTDNSIMHVIRRIYVPLAFENKDIEVYSDLNVSTDHIKPRPISTIDLSTNTPKLIVTKTPSVIDTYTGKNNVYMVYARISGNPKLYGVQEFIATKVQETPKGNIMEYSTKPYNLHHTTWGGINTYKIKAV